MIQMVHKNHQLLQAFMGQLHSAEWCFWARGKKKKAPSYKIIHCYSYRTMSNPLTSF